MIGATLYEGSEVEITIKVDTSRTVTLSAYIPELDQSFDVRSTIHDENINVQEMKRTLEDEEKKINSIKSLCSNQEKEKIEKEVDEVKNSIRNASTDEDVKRKVNIQLKNLQAQINKLKESKNGKIFKDEYKNLLEAIKEVFEDEEFLKFNSNTEMQKAYYQSRMQRLEREGNNALQKNDIQMLQKVNEGLTSLYWDMTYECISYWKSWFERLHNNNQIINNSRCSEFLRKGQSAYSTNNFNELRSRVRELWKFLPKEKKKDYDSNLSGITK